MKKVVIVDYGLGNLRSVFRGLEKAGAAPGISTAVQDIAAADAVLLPGVGAFRDGMEQLGELKSVLVESSRSVPVLGICLGMQMLAEESEEHGLHRGLALIPGRIRRFPRREGFKVPHMGWNSLALAQPDHPLFQGIGQEEYFYFVHSYYADAGPGYSLACTDYICSFSSVIWNRGLVFGTQFHPEKSGAAGLRLLRNFIEMG